MTMPQPQQRFYSVEEYLQMEEKADFRSEYRFGDIIAMAGTTPEHSLIVMNFGREIGNALKGKPCRVYDSNLHVRVQGKQLYTYPDMTIICGPVVYDPDQKGRRRVVINPRVLVEVLSESSEAYDRGRKFEWYREIETMEEYVLVTQTAPLIETYQRLPDGGWRLDAVRGLDAVVKLQSVGVAVALSEIYAGVEFPPEKLPQMPPDEPEPRKSP